MNVHRRSIPSIHENVVRITGPMTGAAATPVAGLDLTQELARFKQATITFAADVVATTDAGASGAFGAQALLTLPAKHVILFGASLDIAMVAAAGITATATVKSAIGTAAEAANDTLDSTQANIIASGNTVLASSAGTKLSVGPASGTPLMIDASAGTQQLFLNFGIADAGSTANSSLTITGTVKLAYLELN